jgi:hypothetical protein
MRGRGVAASVRVATSVEGEEGEKTEVVE